VVRELLGAGVHTAEDTGHKGSAVESENEGLRKLLVLASKKGHVDVVQILLNTLEGKAGCDTDAKEDGEDTKQSGDASYLRALRVMGGDMVQILMETGMVHEVVGNRKMHGNALEVACGNGHAEVAKILAQGHISPENYFVILGAWIGAGCTTQYYKPQGHNITRSGSDAHNILEWLFLAFKVLAKGGSFLSQIQSRSLDPVKVIAEAQSTEGYVEASSYLQSFGKKGVKAKKRVFYSARDTGVFLGADFIARAYREGHEEVAAVFVAADPHAMRAQKCIAKGRDKSELLVQAAQKGHFMAVRFLLDEGGYTAKGNAVEAAREKALLFASSKGHVGVVKILVGGGADINTLEIGGKGETPLIRALMGDHVEVVKVLLQAGANTCMVSDNDDSALRLAAERGQLEIMMRLIWAGADIDKGNRAGETPLMGACKKGQFGAIKILLNAGADLTKQDGNGKTPVKHARKEMRDATEKLLREHATAPPVDCNPNQFRLTVAHFDGDVATHNDGDKAGRWEDWHLLSLGLVNAIDDPLTLRATVHDVVQEGLNQVTLMGGT
jgi:ankyrin repeat protein